MPWLREKTRDYFKRAGSHFITLSKGKDKYEEYFTVLEASERYNDEVWSRRFVKEKEANGRVDRERERSYHLPDVSHTRLSQVVQYGFRHVLTKGISN